MQELDQQELEGLLQFNQTNLVLFLYTPLCGTCKLASEMLGIVTQSLPHITVYRININLVPHVAQKWQVSSVPCLLNLHKDQVVQKVYAMNSVSELYKLLKGSV